MFRQLSILTVVLFVSHLSLAQTSTKKVIVHPRENKEWITSYAYNATGTDLAAVTKSISDALGLKKATDDQAAAALKAAQSATGPNGKVKIPAAK